MRTKAHHGAIDDTRAIDIYLIYRFYHFIATKIQVSSSGYAQQRFRTYVVSHRYYEDAKVRLLPQPAYDRRLFDVLRDAFDVKFKSSTMLCTPAAQNAASPSLRSPGDYQQTGFRERASAAGRQLHRYSAGHYQRGRSRAASRR